MSIDTSSGLVSIYDIPGSTVLYAQESPDQKLRIRGGIALTDQEQPYLFTPRRGILSQRRTFCIKPGAR